MSERSHITNLPIPSSSGLSVYLAQIKKFPMLDAEEEYMLAKNWRKLLGQAHGGKQQPLLFFKYNRSKVFVCTEKEPEIIKNYVYISPLKCYVMVADEWLTSEKIRFIGSGF